MRLANKFLFAKFAGLYKNPQNTMYKAKNNRSDAPARKTNSSGGRTYKSSGAGRGARANQETPSRRKGSERGDRPGRGKSQELHATPSRGKAPAFRFYWNIHRHHPPDPWIMGPAEVFVAK